MLNTAQLMVGGEGTIGESMCSHNGELSKLGGENLLHEESVWHACNYVDPRIMFLELQLLFKDVFFSFFFLFFFYKTLCKCTGHSE